ncbi:succinyldiaminopimelate transaminase [gamma proteobacterium HTCC5015]|nr:succinyldiaminopimelate transaminase [gamma proteobacterium HTCC5015]
MNPDLDKLHPYPFEKLARLKAQCHPPETLEPIALSIGEPRHRAPQSVLDTLAHQLQGLEQYPATKGNVELRETIAQWLERRFHLPNIDAERQVLPVNGTREALFAFAQACVDRSLQSHGTPLVLSPNPFYQIYEGAALLAGADISFYALRADNHYQPDFDAIDAATWRRCQLIYICTPGNPTGAVIPRDALRGLIEKAQQYDFVIASDECYSEIYDQNPPVGLLEVAAEMGLDDYRRCVVFHSLSKRSNLPGLRSGFVAGDAEILSAFLRYRTYHGCAMSGPVQAASITAWSDEQHVELNRAAYRQKFDAVLDILQPVLDVKRPEAGFYLWPKLPVDDEHFARELFAQQHVTVLPGQYLARELDGFNPGAQHARLALVAELENCTEAAQRIRNCIETL